VGHKGIKGIRAVRVKMWGVKWFRGWGGLRKYLPSTTIQEDGHHNNPSKYQNRHEKHVKEHRGVPPWNGQW
jgi:hypothetical protein